MLIQLVPIKLLNSQINSFSAELFWMSFWQFERKQTPIQKWQKGIILLSDDTITKLLLEEQILTEDSSVKNQLKLEADSVTHRSVFSEHCSVTCFQERSLVVERPSVAIDTSYSE